MNHIKLIFIFLCIIFFYYTIAHIWLFEEFRYENIRKKQRLGLNRYFSNLFSYSSADFVRTSHNVNKSIISLEMLQPTKIDTINTTQQSQQKKNIEGNIQQKYTLQEVPIVLVALNYNINNHVPKHTIPFMCTKNKRIVLLTNAKQDHSTKSQQKNCTEIVNIAGNLKSSVSEMPWRQTFPKNQKVFFDRWYVLRDWMRETKTQRIFTMDSDAIMTQNITHFYLKNWHIFRKHEIWIFYAPPRSSFQFTLISLSALEDLTKFWNRMFMPDMWTNEFITGTTPNDMVALGQYIHSSLMKPYPCWGFGPDRAAGTCSMDYAIDTIINRVKRANITAKYSVGGLNLDQNGQATFLEGVVHNNYQHNFENIFAMRKNEKILRFWKGVPQLKLKNSYWMSLWGYILEDEKESCVEEHLNYIQKTSSCTCSDWCCKICNNISTPSLTVWSIWRNNFNFYLITHVQFYLNFWKADRIFLNIGYRKESELVLPNQILDQICSPIRNKFSFVTKQIESPQMTIRKCSTGKTIWVLTYQYTLSSTQQDWSPFKDKLKQIFLTSFDSTTKSMYVDHDEFFVPSYGDVSSVLSQDAFNYHIVEIKPVKGHRKWPDTALEWVDQPYFYRLRSKEFRQGPGKNIVYPAYHWDGEMRFTKLDTRRHTGPFKEHFPLHKCALNGSYAYKVCMRSFHINYHISVPSEEYFMTSKFFDQTTASGDMFSRDKIEIKRRFANHYLNPDSQFIVFDDEYLRAFMYI